MNIELYLDKDIKPLIDEVALLRIKVFREYPYLYDGSLDVEENYLKVFCRQVVLLFSWQEMGKRSLGLL